MERLYRHLKFLKQDQQGGVLVLVAILLMVLMGMAALTIDVGGLYLGRRQAVNAADASVLAAALENNENQARNAAVEYANINNDVNFEGIAFTYFGSGQSNKDTRIITVLVSKQVEFSFARVLGFNESDVLAMASVQQGPGNGLVPFGMMGVECFCCDENAVADETSGTFECGCSIDDNTNGECGCKVGYQDKIWKAENTLGECAKPGEYMQLKYSSWKSGDFGSGNFHPVRLPGQTGGNDYRNDVAGGYTGTLESIAPGTLIDTEPGNMVGPTGHALDDRAQMASGECTYESLKGAANPYDCEMMVIIPLVYIPPGSGGGLTEAEIVGYASFLLNHTHGESGAEVWATLFDYLTYDEIKELSNNQNMEGFVLRLVKDPLVARQNLLNAYNNK